MCPCLIYQAGNMKNRYRSLLFLITFLFISPCLAPAAQFKVTSVYDGETIQAEERDLSFKVRLEGEAESKARNAKIEMWSLYSQG